MPTTWSSTENVRWKLPLPGEGISSPIVWDDWVFITSAEQKGARRNLHGVDRMSGKLVWTYSVDSDNPERTSVHTGHAASTPVTDGAYVIAFFGNGGLLCCNIDGKPLWHKTLGEFDCQDGFVGSPIIFGDMVILACDHSGHNPPSFNSFLIALDKRTGKEIWKTERPGLDRSWSTPIVVPMPNVKRELIVAAQRAVRSYDPATGKQLWEIDGGADWVNPSPVYGFDTLFVAGKNAPFLGINLDQKMKVETILKLAESIEKDPRQDEKNEKKEKVEKPEKAETPNYLWKQPEGGPNYCSPALVKNLLFVVSEDGFVSCFDILFRKMVFNQRLEGKFTASPVAGNDMLYVSNEAGTTYVLKADTRFEVLAVNKLGEPMWATPAISHSCLFLRTDKNLWCVERGVEKK